MALRAWYKLNGDVKNSGIGSMELTQVNSPTWSTGLLGAQALSCGGYKWTAAQAASVLNNSAFSYACWIYVGTSDTRSMIFGNDSGRMFSMFQYPTKNDFHYSWKYDDSGSIFSGVITGALPTGKWTHVCAVYKSGTARFYINGEQRATGSVAMTNSSYSNETNVIHNQADGNHRLQDVRVYDHALSVKEVKELARGMVAHYPMDGLGCDAMPNLATGAWNTDQGVSLGQYYSRMLTDSGFFGLAAGDTYTFRIRITAPADRGVYARIQFFTDDSNRTSISGDAVPAGTTGYSIVKSTLTAAQRAYSRMELCISNANSGSVTSSTTVQVGDLKLERGSSTTTWVPHSASSTYTALGLNSTRLVDVTGHGHDLTWSSATPTVVSGSPRYMTANDFNAARYAVRSSMPLSMAAFTIAFWFKPRTMANQHFILGSFDSWTANGVGIYRDKANPTWFNIMMRSSSQGSHCSFGGQQFTLDAWHFIVITWDSANAKVYLDGELKTTTAYAGGTCEFKNLYLGNSAYSGTPASETDECAMSDFRLYATALTADDITELYKAPVSFTKNGEVHACCISENTGAANPEVRKDGVVEAVAFSELYGRYDNSVRIEPDGSAWMRMVHHGEPGPDNLFASGDSFATSVYKDSKRWFHGKICDYTDRWEFMVVQKIDSSSAATKFRWVQTKNPNNAAYADVPASSITKFTTSGYTNFSYGGIYRMTSNTYYAGNNSSSGNWMGAFGSWATWSGGIPGWTAAVQPTGYLDLYIRLDGGATWSWPANDRVSIIKTDKSVMEYGIVEA